MNTTQENKMIEVTPHIKRDIKKNEQQEEKNAVTELTPEQLLKHAIDTGVTVDVMERLLSMRRELKTERAKEEYDRAMADFQAECPIIENTKEVKNDRGIVIYKYAPLKDIVKQVKDIIVKHGFSYAIQTKTETDNVTATCIAKHMGGHSEKHDVQVPLGNKTPVMSQSQVVAAAITFASRYAFKNTFGILTGDEDTDARPVEQDHSNTDDNKTGKIIKAIEATNNIRALQEFKHKIEKSDKYNEKIKEEISKIIDKKIQSLV